jgi:hypothetical protein
MTASQVLSRFDRYLGEAEKTEIGELGEIEWQ